MLFLFIKTFVCCSVRIYASNCCKTETSIKANRNLWCTTNSECVLTSPPAFQVAVAGRTSLVGKYIIFYCHTKQVEKLVAVLR